MDSMGGSSVPPVQQSHSLMNHHHPSYMLMGPMQPEPPPPPPHLYPLSIFGSSQPPAMNMPVAADMFQDSYFPSLSLSDQLPLVPRLHLPSVGGSSTPQIGSYGFGVESAKRKRGRPRKYVSDNNGGMDLASNTASCAPVMPQDQGSPPAKRGRGRPIGSVKKKMPESSGSSGNGYVLHVLYVEEGEDILAKLYAFSQEGGQTVSVISIHGSVYDATVVQPSLTGQATTFQGPLHICSLAGTLYSESNTSLNQKVGFSITFCDKDNLVIGGEVSGKLIAATQTEVLVASFVEEAKTPNSESSSFPANEAKNPNPESSSFPANEAPVLPIESPASECPSSATHENAYENAFSRFGNIANSVYNMTGYSNMNW